MVYDEWLVVKDFVVSVLAMDGIHTICGGRRGWSQKEVTGIRGKPGGIKIVVQEVVGSRGEWAPDCSRTTAL
jgi:hypothetical protein